MRSHSSWRPANRSVLDVMRARALVQILVMHQHRLAQGYGLAVAERPFAAVAIGGLDIAVEIEAAVGLRRVGAGAVDGVDVPERDITGLEIEIDELRRIESGRGEARIGHCLIEHRALAGELLLTELVGAGIYPHAAIGRAVPIDGEAGLHIGGGEVAERRARPAEAHILVEGELGAGSAGRLPVELVDDLLDVAADERLQ